ncbi:protein GRAVITROPIC IN THE LIGHT 1 [Helianthus annuus]|uniref:protein GRAVITROPIC IN THE LIGHT 1 n=1 Tax=Helianthus annuus TaxID=4232 RepID=UPI001652F257|nr:protein GRAVITROPIC IN THE LIGHT 1 [Helianthus annuus]
MDTKPTSTSRSKLSKTFHKVLPFKKSTKSLSNNGFCLLLPHDNKFKNTETDPLRHFNKHLADDPVHRNRAAMEAFVAKLFATISSLKAAYAELQAAQFPYNGEAVQCADQGVVDELKRISEMKRMFLKKQVDVSQAHVTLLLSEIEEQQSLMKMYEITMNKMEREIKSKDFEISSLKTQLSEITSVNKSIETKLNSSACFPLRDDVTLHNLTPTHFVDVLHYALRSVRSFVKVLVRDMINAHWDIDAAVQAIDPTIIFAKPAYSNSNNKVRWFNRFKRMKSVTTQQLLKENPKSIFGKFTRAKYMRLVHPKMEASLYGNLSQRKTLNTWQYPDTVFFGAFTEMARRVWVLRCLAAAFEKEVSVFMVRKGSRFSEVFMESVTDEAVVTGGGGEVRVGFTVVPGFKIGDTVVQSQVFVLPARR